MLSNLYLFKVKIERIQSLFSNKISIYPSKSCQNFIFDHITRVKGGNVIKDAGLKKKNGFVREGRGEFLGISR